MKKHKHTRASKGAVSPLTKRSAMKQSTFALVIVVCIALFVFAGNCISARSCSLSTMFHSKQVVSTSKGDILVEVVDTASSRERGLSGKKGLLAGEGMLFVFDKPGRYGFWMKDMLFPIDMVWINDDGLVVHVERNVKPETYPTAFINTLDASYVLEIAANESEKYGLYMGAAVTIK
jgi:uncharacterized membrane protein (UPF0127 family)